MNQSFQCKCGADINPQDDKCFECGYPVRASRLNSVKKKRNLWKAIKV